MNDSTQINEAVAEQQLRDGFAEVMGNEPDDLAGMICKISAERAMTQKWEWRKEKSKNWSASLHWL